MSFSTKLFSKSKNKQPEDYYETTITEEYVKVELPKRHTEQILWKDLIEIKLINTDVGPFAPDVWLALIGGDSGCFIPQGSSGFKKVYDIVLNYENFNYEYVTKSMSCTENQEFLLWRKK